MWCGVYVSLVSGCFCLYLSVAVLNGRDVNRINRTNCALTVSSNVHCIANNVCDKLRILSLQLCWIHGSPVFHLFSLSLFNIFETWQARQKKSTNDLKINVALAWYCVICNANESMRSHCAKKKIEENSMQIPWREQQTTDCHGFMF